MSREARVKVVAGALQPKGLDLTQFQRHHGRRPVKLRAADADGVLGFAMADVTEKDAKGNDGETFYGDALAVALLRLKYADQRSRDGFSRAVTLLVHRYGGLARKRSEMVRFCAIAAVFEWVHDACPKCRGRRRSTARHPKGAQPQRDSGMRCVSCRNTGRSSWKRKERWYYVNELVVSHQRERQQKITGIGLQVFLNHWMPGYEKFMDVLHRTDRTIAAGLDLGFHPSKIRPTSPSDESYEACRTDGTAQ
jgi:hypothetical protein